MLGNTDWFIVVDDFSEKKWHLFGPNKAVVGEATESVTKELTSLNTKPKYLHCDNAGKISST